jgi:hypothetical protein
LESLTPFDSSVNFVRAAVTTPLNAKLYLAEHLFKSWPLKSGLSGRERMPNHSVNLTRNSVPRLPGMARYAHTALPGKRVTLPRAGYLKR